MSVRVVARIRPLLSKELDRDVIVRAEPSPSTASDPNAPLTVVRIPNPKNEAEEFSFAFNGVYDQGTSQEELFTGEIAPTLKSLFQGLDVTIFAYGVTGTGKTHTMRGGLKLAERGVIPRLLSAVYRRGRKIVKDSEGETSVAVTLSYYEIYNDKVFDLFEPPEKRTPAGLPLREKDGKTIVVGLSEHECNDLKDFERLYIEANNNRSTAGTKLNAQSSRSHAILMVKLTQMTATEIRVSTASAIDLAGSEDNRRTDNNKDRLVESASINKSLFVLSQCIDAIGRGDRRIPYRESKMTRILSLGQNNGITIMILNLSPLRSYHLDTLSSLNVSSRAKRIEVREIENEVVYKQCPPKTAAPSSSISGSTITRQPLRPLANAHNTAVHAVPAGPKDKVGDKPLKLFSVYSDKSHRVASTALARTSSSTKRPSDAMTSSSSSRPTKIARHAAVPMGSRHVPSAPAGPSATEIEALIERKVAEILAQRERDTAPTSFAPAPAPPSPAHVVAPKISAEVQRRLAALEQKVAEGERAQDERAAGLRYLLEAKQAKERGDDGEALRCYESAREYFPGQEKLGRKIEGLRRRLEEREGGREAGTGTRREKAVVREEEDARDSGFADEDPAEEDEVVQVQVPTRRPRHEEEEEEDNFHPSEADDDDSFVHYHHKQHRRAPAPKPAAAPALSPDAEALILSIINSRDVSKIRELQGVGPKKARDLVEWLELMGEGEEANGGRIERLEQVMALGGWGRGTVERIVAGVAC